MTYGRRLTLAVTTLDTLASRHTDARGLAWGPTLLFIHRVEKLLVEAYGGAHPPT